MLPFIFEWDWSISRLIFMGLLYMALTIIGLGLGTAFVLTLIKLYSNGSQVHDQHEAVEH